MIATTCVAAAVATCVAAAVAIIAAAVFRFPAARSSPVRRRATRSDTDLAVIAVLDVAARELRGGASLHTALRVAREAHPNAPPFDGDVDDAEVAIAGQAVAAASSLGGSPAATLDHAAAVLRERRAVRQERAVHSAQARLSARTLTVVPLAFAAWAAATSRATLHAYVRSPLGAGAVASGLLLNALGWWWMRLIIGRAR